MVGKRLTGDLEKETSVESIPNDSTFCDSTVSLQLLSHKLFLS